MDEKDVIVGEYVNEHNTSLCQKFFLEIKNNYKSKSKAFSVAEAMIALLIGSLALGMAAPMITKQIKTQNFTDAQFVALQRQIEELRESQGVPTGAIMFFDLHRCPDGWDFVGDEYIGDYPRIVGEGDDNEVGDQLEQMVHRHKHVSPIMQVPKNEGAFSNLFRYGPFKTKYKYSSNITGDTDGEFSYPEFNIYYKNNTKKYNENADGAAQLLTGISASGDNNNWYIFTSDGMNRTEIIRGYNNNFYNILTCPNRDEGDSVCKKENNKIKYTSEAKYEMEMTFKNEHYDYMPLVGNENRPNSVKWLACKKGNN